MKTRDSNQQPTHKQARRFWKAGVLASLIAALTCASPAAQSSGNSPASLSITNLFVRLSMGAKTGHCEIADQQAGVTWGASNPEAAFGSIVIRAAGKSSTLPLGPCNLESIDNQAGILATFHPLADNAAWAIRVRLTLLPNSPIVQLHSEPDPDPGVEVEKILPLANTIAVTDQGKGYLLVPTREGLLIPGDSGLKFTHRFDTYAYEGCHMAMLGAVQEGAALLATWDNPYVAVDVKSDVAPNQRQTVSASLALSKSANSFRLQCLGRGDYVNVAKAYRRVAAEKGFVVTWDQKLKTDPERAKLFGAANIKLWSLLDRRMDESSTNEEAVHVNWTFPEAAQVAEHFKKDLKLDRVLFTMGGWIHRGYDNQHPDILPAAPECGGDQAFADCARRVMDQGYLFCLHDNYQDIYRDSPSWNERFVMKTAEGKLARGGHWAGGTAYLTCSKMALELAQRPQNLPAVKALSKANAYFIDTTYAAGLQECFDPQHPLTRADDLKWKQALSDYARETFGVFGSECGREWAIPHSDFFEGLTGVSGREYHDVKLPDQLGATVVPLFDLVYRDCIAMYGKYGYDPNRAALYVLQHISLARPLNYHSIPAHLFWKDADEPGSLALSPAVAECTSTGNREIKITYRWNVENPVQAPWQIFVHFTDSSGKILFQNDHQPDPPLPQWPVGEVRQGPFTVRVPEGLTGTFEVRMGLFQPDTGARARLRGLKARDRSYLVGKLEVSGSKITFQPVNAPAGDSDNLDLFTRSENGWAAGLTETDRFIKNTYEILSPLNELTARMPMMSHEFLSADRKVQRSTFGTADDLVTVTVNSSKADFTCASRAGGELRLPPLGFLAESSQFVAFYSRNWNGVEFGSPALFTLRSVDGKPLNASGEVRVFHAFGDEKIRLRTKLIPVVRESIVQP